MIRPAFFALLLVWSAGPGCTSRPVPENESAAAEIKPASGGRITAFVGTYTRQEGHVDGQAKGIYQIKADTATGSLYRISTVPGIVNPSFLAFSPEGRHLYAVSETGSQQEPSGYVYAYALDDSAVRPLNRQPSHGIAPCHLAVHPSGRFLLVANYGGGIAMYPILPDGSLAEASHTLALEGSGPHPRQRSSHPHSVTIDQEGRFAYVADLGTDKIMIFFINLDNGKLEPAATPYAQLAPGAGPRHLSFHPNGQLLYAINELNSTITVFSYNRADGHLQALQTVSTLPVSFTGGNTCADIHLTPNGRFLYGSNRGHNSIAIFAVDPGSGFLEPLGHQSSGGDIPRNFAIDPFGKFLYAANQNSNNIVCFRIDPQTGGLQKLDELRIPTPVCVRFAPVKKKS